MKRESPYLWASRRAEALVREWGLEALPIDVEAIAGRQGIEVRAMPSSVRGVSGMLQRVGEVYGIAYATFVNNPGFERFSIAHELGHYFLDGHPEALLAQTGMHQSRAGFASGDKHELEADHFAASLLMPGRLFAGAIAKAGSGFSAIERLAATGITSLTATAIRYAECADQPVAVVVSAGSVVDYWFESDAFKRVRGGGWLHRGEPLPSGTPTAAFNRDPGRVERFERREESSSVRAWFGEGPDLELAEDVVGLGSYAKTLTVLFAEVAPPDEVEEEDEKLGAWEPTLHKSR